VGSTRYGAGMVLTTWAQELDERGQQVNGKEEYVLHDADGTTTSVTCEIARRRRLTA
jgi:hypothetical protein